MARPLSAFGAVLVAWTLVWNAVVTPGGNPDRMGAFGDLGRHLFLQQGFAMFATPAEVTGFVSIDGVLRDGRRVDLMSAGGRVPASPEAALPSGDARVRSSKLYANSRWRSLLRKVAYGESYEIALHYGRHMCRTWNTREPSGAQLMTFEVVFIHRDVPWSTGDGSYKRQVVWTHDCFS